MADPQQINEINNMISQFTFKMTAIASGADKSAADCRESFIEKLELAMTKAYKVAVFIRQDFDGRAKDEAQMNSLSEQLMQALQEVGKRADSGLKAVQEFTDQVRGTMGNELVPTSQRVRQLMDSDQMKLKNSENELVAAQDRVYRNAAQMANFEAKLRETEDERSRVDMMMKMAWMSGALGGSIIGAGDAGPFGPRLEALRDALNHSRDEYTMSMVETRKLQENMMDIRLQIEQEIQILQRLDVIISDGQRITDRCQTLEQQLGPLKEIAGKLLMNVESINASAGKVDLAKALLNICVDALMDARLTDEVQMIKDELVKEYGGEVPTVVLEMVSLVDGKLGELGVQ
ncbi:hypothetical protein H072_1569 [Dactylellina haptotyla CBS 200.50]|uniref:Uncharacterized protein n=1 Tax=Dactylellina haptotyla (strain CBS 200.50) TaxID=1284197 RepID=S8ANN6_DACHA|nr:hypothetical protein H072_1569 [Dactylellina haptotyla CBS 200.50]